MATAKKNRLSKSPRSKSRPSSRRTPRRPAASDPRRALSAVKRSEEIRSLPLEQVTTAGFSMKPEEVERALLTGEESGILENYFGPKLYQELRELSQQASSRQVRGGPRVLVLPGILGSTIGRDRKLFFLDDVYWFDPIDIFTGRMADLTLDAPPHTLSPLGVILFTYLKLKLNLQLDGYDADFFPYDWRKGIRDAALRLLDRIADEESSQINLVAHSMGGLVSRAAIAIADKERPAVAKKIRRLVMLGTPNHGSFAPVQALRGTYSVIKTITSMDRVAAHTAEWFAEHVFSSFLGLTQMLPTTEKFSGVDLYRAGSWPTGLRARQTLLDQVQPLQASLAAGDNRMFLIAGVNRETTVGLRIENNAFVYEQSKAGDGTVPLEFARLAGVRTWYIDEQHSSLPNNNRVARAVADILDQGETPRLHADWAAPTAKWEQTEAELIEETRAAVEAVPSLDQIRHLAEPFISPDATEEIISVAAPAQPTSLVQQGFTHSFDQIIVGRRRQHRVDMRFALGSITELDTRAYVVGVFKDVTPAGAAAAIDKRMNGAISDMVLRRMFSGDVGEILILPTGRSDLRAEHLVFVGLGMYDRFNEEVQQIAAENVVRTLVKANVEEFGTVLFGAASGGGVERSLQNLVAGFIRGLTDADQDHRFRRIVLCELDAGVFQKMKEEMFRLSSTDLCREIEMTFDERILPVPMESATPRTRYATSSQATYLIVRREMTHSILSEKDAQSVRAAVLTSGGQAAVVSESQPWDENRFRRVRSLVENPNPSVLRSVGAEVAELMLPPSIRTVLSRSRDTHLVIVHDRESAGVPWELLTIDEWSPALGAGMSHRYLAENLSIAKWMEERQDDERFTLLLVTNPTEDLAGAEAEGALVRSLFGSVPGVAIEDLHGSSATKPALLSAFRSGRFDAVHYAGHAYFDEMVPASSGIVCAGGVVLSGAELAGVGRLPALMFFNACESGKLRKLPKGVTTSNPFVKPSGQERVDQASGLAEAFLRGGVANFIGTYWPVGDLAAKEFASTFYRAALEGKTIGASINEARRGLFALKDGKAAKDWADYIHYGHAEFVLKRK